MSFSLGVLLIGQTPDVRYERFFRSCLPESAGLLLVGALDGLPVKEILAFDKKTGDDVLVTRVGADVPVTVPAHEVHSRMQQKAQVLVEKGASAIAVACTGEFPFLEVPVPLLMPGRLLVNTVTALTGSAKTVGVIVPLEEQIPMLSTRWTSWGIQAFFEAADPFGDRDLVAKAAMRLGRKGVGLIALDCMAYDAAARQMASDASSCLALAARTWLGRAVMEFFGKEA
jgi:protein AroM